MTGTSRRAYAVAVLATVVAGAGTWVLWPLLHANSLLLFLGAVAVSAWHGGRGPGLIATGLGVLLNDFFFARSSPRADG